MGAYVEQRYENVACGVKMDLITLLNNQNVSWVQ
jgi:hypothetical protein